MLGVVIAVGALALFVVGMAWIVEGAEAKTSSQLRQERASKVKEASAIAEKAKAENRAMTDDETAQVEKLLSEADELKAAADSRSRGEDLVRRLDAAASDLRKPAPRPPLRSSTTANTNDSVDLREPDSPLTSGYHDRAKDDKAMGFRGYDDFAAMVLKCSNNGVVAHEWANRPEISAAYGQNTFNGDEGGFMIPTEFSNRIYTRAMDGSALRAAVFGPMEKYALGGNSVEFVAGIDHDRSSTQYRYGGIIVYLVDEGGQITRSTAKVRKGSLKLHKLGAISFATSEELADGGFTGTGLMNKHADAMGDCWLEYALFGTGAGQPIGMFHASNPARISTTIENNQTADTITSINVLDMEDDLWSESEAGALWLANRETRKVLRLLKYDIGTAGQLLPLFERGQGQQNMLDGFTLWFTDHMKALGDAGDIGICDPRQYAWATKRGAGIEQASSIHLRFDYDETAFRSTWRADGRPLWDRALTPRNGASGKEESPFVILAERA